jgi:hypothetical protein
LSLPYVLVGSAVAVIVAFAVTSWFWPTPRLADASSGRPLGPRGQTAARVVATALRVAGLLAFFVVLESALFGTDATTRNIAPVAVYVWFWVGIQVASVVVGNVWGEVSPYQTAGRMGEFPRRASAAFEPWTAPLLLFSFAWLELAYFDASSPRALGTWMAAYSVVVMVGLVSFGRQWLAHGEGFAAFFGLEARMGPLFRDAEGAVRIRPPVTGLATVEVRRGTALLIMVALGSTAFDGVSGTTFWLDVTRTSTGWTYTALNTVGLIWIIGMAAVIYLAATRGTAAIAGITNEESARAFLPSLVPIAFGYVIAHYFSALVFEGQLAIALVSDPMGRGWDLFGTADYTIDFNIVSAGLVSWVQVAAIVAGHVIGVVVAHDRAVELFPRDIAVKSQVPLVAAMVVYTVGGLALLLG